MRVNFDVCSIKKADFIVDEIGGKNKGDRQIKNVGTSFLVKDAIEYGFRHTIPLWAFGMNHPVFCLKTCFLLRAHLSKPYQGLDDRFCHNAQQGSRNLHKGNALKRKPPSL